MDAVRRARMMEEKDNLPASDGNSNDFLPDGGIEDIASEDTAALRHGMRKNFSRIGWALVVVLVIWQLLMTIVGFAAVLLEEAFGVPAVNAYYRYLLLFNEGTLAAAMFIGSLILRLVPRKAPEKRPFSGGQFVQLLMICFAVSIVGNLIGMMILSVWNIITGSSVGSTVSEVLLETDPWLNLLMAGILAPILEELFFRKWLIDRMHPYGEKVCILMSALLFALFHMNFSQFFYAFGAGLILAYLYCRSGKVWLCMLLHAIFNCFSGVLGSEISNRLMEFLNSIAGMTQEELVSLPLSSFAILFGALLYYFAVYGMAIAGLVLFCVKIRRFRFQPGEIVIPEKARSVVFVNAGMIAALIFTIGMMVYSLFV